MAWVTYANPNSLSRKRSSRKLSTNNGVLTGLVDSINTLSNVYKGRQDRIQRYTVYDQMDQDSDVARALDLMAEHCVPAAEDTEFPFQVHHRTTDTSEEVATSLTEQLSYWIKLNQFENRAFENVRAALKYGDWFYWRNPKTFELYDINPKLVIGAIVNPERLEILGWIVKGVKFNIEDGELVDNSPAYETVRQTLVQTGQTQDCRVITAVNMVQVSLNSGKYSGLGSDDQPDSIVTRWPFGESILEPMYKTYKQRELMEEASLIHRIQRAPTRRVWYIGVGKTRPDKAKWIINDFRNEMNLRRVPQQFGQDGKTTDSIYNPQSTLEDYYIPVTADGQNSKVENLEGQPWNDIPELKYMTSKMLRAMRVPYSMLLGPDEGGGTFNDSKVGTAYMQEIEFTKFCMRIQKKFKHSYDHEFKMFCEYADAQISAADYELRFNPPTNFEDFLHNSRAQDNITVWSQIKDEPYISRQMGMIHYLKWTPEMIRQNERWYIEENYPLNSPVQGDGGLGAMPGTGGLGGLPPPMGDPSGMGDIGGDEIGAENGMSAAGMGTVSPDMGGMAAPAMGEARMNQRRKPLVEEDLSLSDLEPSEKKQLPNTGIYKARTRDDDSFMQDDRLRGNTPVTLSLLRKLRRAHMQRRIENEKRIRVVQHVYKRTGEASGEAGIPPMG